MYDKTIRRRRAVLALLVAGSLILLTAYFGETRAGPLHGVQRGASEVLNPIQDGASRALKPVRDLFGWFGDTLHAKGDVEDLRAERNRLRTEALRAQGALAENKNLRAMLDLDQSLSLSEYRPLTGRVIAQSPTVWYATVRVNKGSADGVHEGDPVINEEALIGPLTEVFHGAAQVTLITDTTSQVSVLAGPRNIEGIAKPASAGNPKDLVLDFVPAPDLVKQNDTIVTRGTVSDRASITSRFPRGLPVGRVTRVDNAGTDTEEIHLRPFADMRSLDFVQVLTNPGGSDKP